MRFRVRVIHRMGKRRFCSPNSARYYNKFMNKTIKLKKRYMKRMERNIPRLSKGEMRLRDVCRDIFKGFKINYNDRKVLKGLELDIYIPELKIGIEYNGNQHYYYTKEFHKNANDFLQQKWRDEVKAKLCKEMNICLLILRVSNEKKIRQEINNFMIIRDASSKEVELLAYHEGGKGLSHEGIPEPLPRV